MILLFFLILCSSSYCSFLSQQPALPLTCASYAESSKVSKPLFLLRLPLFLALETFGAFGNSAWSFIPPISGATPSFFLAALCLLLLLLHLASFVLIVRLLPQRVGFFIYIGIF